MKTQFCHNCHIQKPLDQFHVLLKQPNKGKLSKLCKICTARQKKYKATAREKKLSSPTKPAPIAQIDTTKKVDMGFLENWGGWSELEIKELLLTVQAYKAAPHRMSPKDIYERFFAGRGVAGCSKIIKEFREAADNGYTFDEYMKTGRKFRRDGKKVVAPGKK